MLYSGLSINVQDVKPNMKLMGQDSYPRNVISVTSGKETMYNIIPDDGYNSYTVNESHILSVIDLEGKICNVNVVDYINSVDKDNYYGYRAKILMKESKYEDKHIIEYGQLVSKIKKEIIDDFKIGSISQRSLLVSTIIKNIGIKLGSLFFIKKAGTKFDNDLVCLCNSIGNEVKQCKDNIYISIISKPYTIYSFNVQKMDIDDYYGFEIDGNRLFCLEDCTVTHNTVIGLKLISDLKMKTLIVVHKQVLLDQWIERINEFLPDANVGIIKGPKLDIVDKDIVVGMVQTLTQKTFPSKTFNDFGFLVCDEVHAMCSKTFSDILFKIQTPYKLGLSATPDRKDGFDKVIKYHIGDKIIEMYKTLIEPRVITYEYNPDIIIKQNRFGKTNLPVLLTDLSKDEKRNNFIIEKLIENVLQNRKIVVFSDRVDQCNKLLCLFNKKKEENTELSEKVADTFIGKKNKKELDEALKANIILATYGVFKEGVDCPELDTLLFATPKSDVVQAIGRILRQKNKNEPVIIDIHDNIGPLSNQFIKRRRFYKSKKYDITEM